MIGGVVAASSLSAQTLGRKSINKNTVIDEAGSYVLVTDLSLSSNSTADAAIIITASGVTLDLNGHQITGPGGLQGVGILVDGAKGVTIRNGHIAYMFIGVRVAGNSNVKLNDLNIRGMDIPVAAPPPEIGVMIAQSQNVEVEDVNISRTGLGVFVRGGQSTGNRIANNTITAGDNGAFAICYNPTPDDPEGPRATSSPATFFLDTAWELTSCPRPVTTSLRTTPSLTSLLLGNRRTPPTFSTAMSRRLCPR